MQVFWLLIVLGVLGGIQAFLFHNFNFKGLKYRRYFSKTSVFEGEQVELVEEIINRKLLPVPWLRVESRISPFLRFESAQAEREIADEQYHKSVFFLAPFSKVVRRHTIRCTHRGDFRLATVEVTAGDLIGFSRDSALLEVNCRLLVYPKLLNEDEVPLPSRKWQGDMVIKRWIMPDPFLVGGIRAYLPGDPMRDVHWGASARTGQLQVKTRDFTADPKLMVVLNIQMMEKQWAELMDYEQGTIEYGISLAATNCMRALEAGVEAGFACNGCMNDVEGEIVRILPQRGEGQIEHILSAMARLSIHRERTFHSFLDELSALQDMDMLILSAYDSELLQQGISQLRMRGNSVELQLLDLQSQTRTAPAPTQPSPEKERESA